VDRGLQIRECAGSAKQKPDGDLTIATRALCGFRRSYIGALGKAALLFFRYRLARGTAKYASLAPVTGSVIALPVISPLSFMSLAVSRMAE